MDNAAPILPKHGYPKDRYMPKCTTEYGVNSPIWEGRIERMGSLFQAEEMARRFDLKVYARIVTEWIEIDEEADRSSTSPAG